MDLVMQSQNAFLEQLHAFNVMEVYGSLYIVYSIDVYGSLYTQHLTK
jgi:hypothetical protein